MATSDREKLEAVRERAKNLSYPVQPHRKQARVYWSGKHYHFGRHNSDRSVVVFNRWRSALIESGQASTVQQIRLALDQEAEQEASQPTTTRASRLPAVSAAIAVAAMIVTLASVLLSGSKDPADTSSAMPGSVESVVQAILDEEALREKAREDPDGVLYVARINAALEGMDPEDAKRLHKNIMSRDHAKHRDVVETIETFKKALD